MTWRLGDSGFPWPLSAMQDDQLHLGGQEQAVPSESGPSSSLGEDMSRGHVLTSCPLPAWDGSEGGGWGDLGERGHRFRAWWGCCGQVSRGEEHQALPISHLMLQGVIQGTVPYLGTFLTDLVMLDTAMKDYLYVSEPGPEAGAEGGVLRPRRTGPLLTSLVTPPELTDNRAKEWVGPD